MTMHDVATTGEDFEYRGLSAATWDLFRGDTSNWEDRVFFRDMIRESRCSVCLERRVEGDQEA